MNSTTLKAFVTAVGLAGLAGTALLPREGLAGDAPALLLLLVLAALAGSRSVRIPGLKIQISAADMFTFCALVSFAPVAMPLVALAGVLGATFGPNRRPLSLRTAFNFGAVTLSAVAAASLCTFVAPGPDPTPYQMAGPLIAGAAVFLAVNLFLVMVVVRLETGRDLLGFLSAMGPCATVACLTSAVFGGGLALMLQGIGPSAAVLGLLCTGPLVAYFKAHRDRLANLTAAAPLEPAQV